MSYQISVLGGGAWGTALAQTLAAKGYSVLLWAREPEVVDSILNEHENKIFLPGVALHENLKATSSLKEACTPEEFLVSVIPAQFVRSVWSQAATWIPPNLPVVSASKGIETTTLKLLKDVFEEILPDSSQRFCFLSGPNFATEVSQGLPAASTLAGLNLPLTQAIQEKISTPVFRLYLSQDVIGVEVGGAVKNVIAIAAGIVDGMGFGHSSRASLMTRGLNEMIRLGVALGADPLTFSGLSGLGDLILTCTGGLSRNRTLGMDLAHGKTLDEILGSRKTVAEGVATAEAVHRLAEKHGLDLPVCEQVYQMLYHQKSCAEVLQTLATRELKSEF